MLDCIIKILKKVSLTGADNFAFNFLIRAFSLNYDQRTTQ